MTGANANFIQPDWPAPAHVRALATTRLGGVSQGCYASLNLGDHVGDDPLAVSANRAILRQQLPADPVWLRQVHGTRCIAADVAPSSAEADAAFSRKAQTVCVVMTADCLPILLCDAAGTVVAAAHAGWRGLVAGVIEDTVAAMACPATELMAWLGPAIGPAAFEVGDEVRDCFLAQDAGAAQAFARRSHGKWLCDIHALARRRLRALGVRRIAGADFCTASDPGRFFSYRRDGTTGRMASLIWLERTV